MKNHSKLLTSKSSVRYQDHNPNCKWTNLHIFILIRDYEYILDMRKLCKRSVSLLVSIAVVDYLEEVLHDLNLEREGIKSNDNYQFLHYIIIKELINNVICWKIYWGLPENTTQMFP